MENRLIDRGVYYNTKGPSLETKAEIIHLQRSGVDLVGMTSAREAIAARELEVCYATIATADNYACGIGKSFQVGDIKREAKKREKDVRRIIQESIPYLLDAECKICPYAAHEGLVSREKPRWF